MPLTDRTTFERSLSALPLVTYQAGETVIADGSRTGRLLILRRGAVAIVKEETEIAKGGLAAPRSPEFRPLSEREGRGTEPATPINNRVA